MEPNDTTAHLIVGRQEGPIDLEKSYVFLKDMVERRWKDPGGRYLGSDERAGFLAAALSDIDVPMETARRMAKWLVQYKKPQYPVDLEEIFGGAFSVERSSGMVIEKDISVTALCEHHMLPFMGRAAIGYIPKRSVVGLSKMIRLLNALTLKPTMQENITNGAADAMEKYLEPHGVMVVMYDMTHMCVSARGVEDEHANTTTSAVRGVFAPGHEEAPAARNEFLSLLAI